jgi:HipA-like protein
MSLGVYWDRAEIGKLRRADERSRAYYFQYTTPSRAISLSLPISKEPFTPAQTRPFFEALLPEDAVRQRIAGQLKLAASDSYGLLSALGRDCAGALQILEAKRISETPSVRWLDTNELDALIEELPVSARHTCAGRAPAPQPGRRTEHSTSIRLHLASIAWRGRRQRSFTTCWVTPTRMPRTSR